MNSQVRLSEEHALNLTESHRLSKAVSGTKFEIGNGFQAIAFRDNDFLNAMDPLVMVDHYRMSKPTFGAHPHAGLSAVSVIFEDSIGKLHNQDSLGNNFDIMPGDLYWLKAGSGVIHDEAPLPKSAIHGLQVFVYLPSEERQSTPASLHVKADDMPIIKYNGSRVRVVLGESNGLQGHKPPTLPMTILDGFIDQHAYFLHQLNQDENAWIYAVEGKMEIEIGDNKVNIASGQAIAISKNISNKNIKLSNVDNKPSHFTLFTAKPNNESYIHKGPFVMKTEEEITLVEANFAAGKFGTLN